LSRVADASRGETELTVSKLVRKRRDIPENIRVFGK